MQAKTRTDYRARLRSELGRRQLSNPRFSLRSFARTLELSPAFLSKVLRGQKHLSMKSAARIAAKLRYSPGEVRGFCQQVQLARAPESVRAILARGGSAEASGALDEAIRLELDTFQAVSDWYHLAIRELAAFRDFKGDPRWIARKLGITPVEASQAVERLARLGLLRRKGGRWVPGIQRLTTPSEQPSQAIRHHHSQMIQKAFSALENQNVDRRSITGTLIPISRDKVEIAKREIRRFHSRMLKLLDSSEPDEVYQLNVQFFALTEEEKP